jgi:hypothetical protein
VANTFKQMADILYLLDRPAEASAYYRAELALRDRFYKDKPDVEDNRRSFANVLNNLAWLLVSTPDLKVRDPELALGFAERAVDLDSTSPLYHGTLGVARYRTMKWDRALESLGTSIELSTKERIKNASERARTIAQSRFFRAMVFWQQDKKMEAEMEYDLAMQSLAMDNAEDVELHRFQEEARQLLGRAPDKRRPGP